MLLPRAWLELFAQSLIDVPPIVAIVDFVSSQIGRLQSVFLRFTCYSNQAVEHYFNFTFKLSRLGTPSPNSSSAVSGTLSLESRKPKRPAGSIL